MSKQLTPEVIINGRTVELEDTILTEVDMAPYRETAKHIKICNSAIGIGNKAFSHFKVLESIEIPDSITFFGENSFSQCIALQSISIPESVVSIGKYAFGGCDNIKIEIKGANCFSKESFCGYVGRPLNIVYKGDDYSVMCYNYSGEMMVVTGYVDYSNGKIFSGYVFDGRFDSPVNDPVYCYVIGKCNFHESTLSRLKNWIDLYNKI